MKATLRADLVHQRQLEVNRERTISFMGEDLRVYGTPYMVLDVEQTCRALLMEHHEPGEDSVGARVEIEHLRPSLLGQTVTVTVRVLEVELPRVQFEVEVRDELELVGRARHTRFVVDRDVQAGRLQRKAIKVGLAKQG